MMPPLLASRADADSKSSAADASSSLTPRATISCHPPGAPRACSWRSPGTSINSPSHRRYKFGLRHSHRLGRPCCRRGCGPLGSPRLRAKPHAFARAVAREGELDTAFAFEDALQLLKHRFTARIVPSRRRSRLDFGNHYARDACMLREFCLTPSDQPACRSEQGGGQQLIIHRLCHFRKAEVTSAVST